MPKILISPDYGAGWTTWHHTENRLAVQFMLCAPVLIEAIESKSDDQTNAEAIGFVAGSVFDDKFEPGSALEKFVNQFKQMFPQEDLPYMGGLRDIQVIVVPDGQPFRIDEYDGFESVRFFDPEDFFVFGGQPTFELPGQKTLPQGDG